MVRKISKRVRFLATAAWVLAVPALGATESKLIQPVPCQRDGPSVINGSVANESAFAQDVGAFLRSSCPQPQVSAEPAGSSIPVITGMSFPRRVVEVAGRVTWYLYFTDLDKDANWARFEEFNGTGWMDAGQVGFREPLTKTGEIRVVTQCLRVTTSLARVWLYDRAEHRSEPYYYVVNCQAAFESPTQSGRSGPHESDGQPAASPQEMKRSAHVLTRYLETGIEFTLDGFQAQESQLQIFDLAGGLIFTGGWSPSVRVRWDLIDNESRPVPNGVYLFVIVTRGGEKIGQISPRKLVLLR